MGISEFFNSVKKEIRVIKGEESKDKLYASRNNFGSREAALTAFQRSKEKLLHVNKWSELPGISAAFRVYDPIGNIKASGRPDEGDFLFIDLPGPTPETWVKVIDKQEDEDWAEFTVSPSPDPRERGEKKRDVEHFFADKATSTFRVELNGTSISAMEIGKEEGINNQGTKAGGRELINTVVAVGGWIALQEMQWRKLTDYLVHKIELQSDKQRANKSTQGPDLLVQAYTHLSGLSTASKLSRAALASLPATTLMTALSYALSNKVKGQYKEPELLSYLVHQQPMVRLTGNYKFANKTTGYLLHYLAGVGYSAGYEFLWKPTVKLPDVVKGASYGVAAGLAGVLVWESAIQLSKKPPRLQKSRYYPHLVLAHVIFGVTTALASKALRRQ